MGLFQLFRNAVIIKITCADPPGLISEVVNHGYTLRDINFWDDITVLIEIAQKDEASLKEFFTEKSVTFFDYERKNVAWGVRKILKRPVILCGFLIFLILTLSLPNRILFICVEGNENVSAESILSYAENGGVHFGSCRKNVRSEKIKNLLLENIPQLQWAGINTRGCVAVISVREGEKTNSPADVTGICSVVASRDGVIQKMTVHSGNPVCAVGQSVRKGQVLVSGYVDCGVLIRAERANAEIYGDTVRDITAKILPERTIRTSLKRNDTKFSVVFGKKRINLFKDTGILDSTCVKMYKQYYVALPGNFVMPFSVIAIDEYHYQTEVSSVAETGDFGWMENVMESYLHKQMLSGMILEKSVKSSCTDNIVVYYGAYACREIIGKLHSEEIYTSDGETG